MPITKSAIKRMRSDKKKNERNTQVKSRLKTLSKQFTQLVVENNVEKAQTEARRITKELDSAASKGIIPQQRASRKKARINKNLHKLVTAQTNK